MANSTLSGSCSHGLVLHPASCRRRSADLGAVLVFPPVRGPPSLLQAQPLSTNRPASSSAESPTARFCGSSFLPGLPYGLHGFSGRPSFTCLLRSCIARVRFFGVHRPRNEIRIHPLPRARSGGCRASQLRFGRCGRRAAERYAGFQMRKPRVRRILCIASAVLAVWLMALPRVYEHTVTAQLTRALDSRHGEHGWAVLWRAADAQPGEGIALVRTLYVRLLFPRLQQFTPWKDSRFTHTTTTPNRPWHYAICVVSAGREITYFWSIRQHRWIQAWDNNTHNFPADVQRDYAARLRSIERRRGLNWSSNDPGR